MGKYFIARLGKHFAIGMTYEQFRLTLLFVVKAIIIHEFSFNNRG